MDRYYSRMLANGRQISIECLIDKKSKINFSTVIRGETLAKGIENWIREHAIKSNYFRGINQEHELTFDEIRIPLLYTSSNGEEIGANAEWFAESLSGYIMHIADVNCKISTQSNTLSSIIISDKPKKIYKRKK